MDIHEIDLVSGDKKIPLKYTYPDHMKLNIHLDRTYHRGEQYTLYIDYTAKPNDLNSTGSRAIISDKGLYFINPHGTDHNKPIQIWTQGETESNSCWFPTIDHPDQKTTEEIDMTVPDKYVTLSNGLLTDQHKNGDGTRTDTWKLDKPNAPYLFMMAVGDFVITHDHWRNIPVDYYLEPAYAPYAKQIFGNTPEMIGFFSKILKYDYPWPKYDQIVVRDYVSGAMENTTATLHGEYVQKTPRELLDNNSDDVISHELFHQWFGDLVTTESWSNITVNESMADYAETLWDEHKYGKDKAEANNYNDLLRYLNTPASRDHNLVPFYYSNREAVFDNVSYPKGGYILSMLRNYVGDSAFFDALHEYLVKHQYGNGEAQQLRLAFEDVTGWDLNWFWDQWYYGKGYPELDISYQYDDQAKQAKVFISQIQDNPRIFRLPMAIDVYANNRKHRIRYQMDAQKDTITIPYPDGVKPDLINVDGDKYLLALIHDHKSLENYIYQYKHAGTYVDRRQAIEAASQNQGNDEAVKFLAEALKDPFDELRILAVHSLDLGQENIKKTCLPILEKMADNDPETKVKAAVIRKLGELKDKKYESLFIRSLKSPSYSVEAAGLQGLYAVNEKQGLRYARGFLNDHRGDLDREMAIIFSKSGSPEFAGFFNSIYEEIHQRYRLGRYYIDYLTHVKDPDIVKKSVDHILSLTMGSNNRMMLNYLKSSLEKIQESKTDSKDLSAYLKDKIDSVQQKMDRLQ